MSDDIPAWRKKIQEALQTGAPELDLTKTDIDNAGLKELWVLKDQLTSLCLYKCEQITNAGVQAIAENLKELTTLGLGGGEQITNAGVQAIAKNLTKLTSLHVFGCEQITNAGVQAIAKNLTKLTSLHVYGCEQITNAGVQAIAKNLTKLTSLHLYRCEQITNAGVQVIADNLKELTTLCLFGCGQITDDGILTLINHPNLRELVIRGTKSQVPMEIIETNDAFKILAWIKASREETANPLYQVKCMVVGQGEVGKSSLVRWLFPQEPGDETFLAEPNDRTHAFDCREVNITDIENNEWKVTLWDFGGQTHLHGSHRFFLSADHSFYILAIRADYTYHENRLNYWLRFLAKHTKSVRHEANAPVLIVITHCDKFNHCQMEHATNGSTYQQLRYELDQAKHEKWLGCNVIGVVDGLGISRECQKHQGKISKHHLQGIKKIKDYLSENLPSTPGSKAKFLPVFYDAKTWIEDYFSNQAKHFDYTNPPQEFRQLLEKLNSQEEQGMDTEIFLQIMRSLGLLHWVGDVVEATNTVARSWVINPHWVKKPIYELLWKNVPHENGFIKEEQLLSYLQNCGKIINHHEQGLIRSLLYACQVAYEISRSSDQGQAGILVPDLIRRERIVEEEWENDCVSLVYKDLNFIPENAFLRLISKYYDQISIDTTDMKSEWLYRNEMQIIYNHEILRQDFQVMFRVELNPADFKKPKLVIKLKHYPQRKSRLTDEEKSELKRTADVIYHDFYYCCEPEEKQVMRGRPEIIEHELRREKELAAKKSPADFQDLIDFLDGLKLEDGFNSPGYINVVFTSYLCNKLWKYFQDNRKRDLVPQGLLTNYFGVQTQATVSKKLQQFESEMTDDIKSLLTQLKPDSLPEELKPYIESSMLTEELINTWKDHQKRHEANHMGQNAMGDGIKYSHRAPGQKAKMKNEVAEE